MLYRKAVQKNLVRGRSIEGVAAATLYGACRQCEVPRTLDEITKASNATKKEVGRTYRYISRELGLNLMPASPVSYITRYSRELGLSGRLSVRNNVSNYSTYLPKCQRLLSGPLGQGHPSGAVYMAPSYIWYMDNCFCNE